ncbi:hypothetical protein J437_LFUL005743 [Ladona fulva]|uniref:Integrase catalytic domain-containing protein n=1 Tax=Ladona fulva TaxID=123851 RepID=A0A8K0NYQ7_LADFU|nr:hypothetical protein J437_LFUL005743 [Ladona fulva]
MRSVVMARLHRVCTQCQQGLSNPPKVPAIPWSTPTKPWSRLPLEFAGAMQGQSFLIQVDAFSKWIDVEDKRSSYSANTVVRCRNWFATHRLPDEVVTDNIPGFRASKFTILQSNSVKNTPIYTTQPPMDRLKGQFRP